ncbi:fungal-specific transcription factor domain-containing protein [Dactylonectria macrodidyma]|uniref:Fungal-specific transcription factor domain-containing protein n=1 Tax=Dactylonectria macrodidyma TaxID=307937 RepID=A0A9P9FUR6_9HYPO|nr:fungal-specific transcription factor domain-containing protein [Dactylonectria macrodidyma]
MTHDVDLLERISTIESALRKLSQGSSKLEIESLFTTSFADNHTGLSSPDYAVTDDLSFQAGNDAFSIGNDSAISVTEESTPNEPQFDCVPPSDVLRSLVHTYFSQVHNRPYSFFHRATFEQKLDSGAVPKCLIFAILALAVRFSDAPYFAGRAHEASSAYSRQSWLCVIEDHLSVDDNLDLPVIQTVTLLAIVDYTAGRTSSGWLRLGLAIRLSQDADLISEPPDHLAATEREERRRSFWSIYLVDKLMSCARSRPATISDHDCTLQLPCDEQTFQAQECKQTPTLQEMLDWNADVADPPSHFSLTIATASILARCTRTAHGRTRGKNLPPWDPQSEYTAINASLLLLESHLKGSNASILELVRGGSQGDDVIDEHQIGHLFFAHVLFHLSQCLLNHPFLIRLRLKPIAARAPASFTLRAANLAQDHARQLTSLLATSSGSGVHLDSSFYPYCTAIAAGIHCLALGSQQQSDSVDKYDAQLYFDQSMEALERFEKLWPIAMNMLSKLYELNAQSGAYSYLNDSPGLGDVLDVLSEDFLWSLVDYGKLSRESPKTQAEPASFLSTLPSPCTWATLIDE